jgi:hypothetical protein
VAGLVRIPFRTRDAEATETLARRATVVIVGTTSSSDDATGSCNFAPCCLSLKRISENVYSTVTMS